MSYFFFLKKKNKECWYYTGKTTSQIWAKMECNLFSETLISNVRRKEIKNVFESIKLQYVLNYLMEIIKILLKLV